MEETELTTSSETARSQADSAWREAVKIYFKQFLSFFFPQIYDDADFEKGYEFLDKKLEKIAKNAERGKKFVDKLVKICLKDGTEKWLLIHLDVHGHCDVDFARRVWTYNCRILDRYDKQASSLAILTDDNQGYRPCQFEIKRWDFRLFFKFPTVKLTDYKDKVEELEASRNPFGIIVLAHLKNLESKNDDQARLKWKVSLSKALYLKGYSRENIMNLYRFIDWLMVLPKELDLKFQDEMKIFEEGMNEAKK